MKKTTKAAQQNPLTTILGILTVAAGLAPIWAPATIAPKVQASAAVLAGVGLGAAADARKEK